MYSLLTPFVQLIYTLTVVVMCSFAVQSLWKVDVCSFCSVQNIKSTHLKVCFLHFEVFFAQNIYAHFNICHHLHIETNTHTILIKYLCGQKSCCCVVFEHSQLPNKVSVSVFLVFVIFHWINNDELEIFVAVVPVFVQNSLCLYVSKAVTEIMHKYWCWMCLFVYTFTLFMYVSLYSVLFVCVLVPWCLFSFVCNMFTLFLTFVC